MSECSVCTSLSRRFEQVTDTTEHKTRPSPRSGPPAILSRLHDSKRDARSDSEWTGEVRRLEQVNTRQALAELAEPPGRVGLEEGHPQLVAKPRPWAGRRRRRRHAPLRLNVLDLHRASRVARRHARRVEGDDDDGGVVAAIALLYGAIDQALGRLFLGIGAAALVERTPREVCDLLRVHQWVQRATEQAIGRQHDAQVVRTALTGAHLGQRCHDLLLHARAPATQARAQR